MPSLFRRATLCLLSVALLAEGGCARAWGERFHRKQETPSAPSPASLGTLDTQTLAYGGRDILLYLPAHLPAPGSRALVVVLHGGMGNAQRIVTGRSEHPLNLNALADKYGFAVAYLNGTAVTRRLGADKEGWNAGKCCGQPAARQVDDVGYIVGAVQYLERQYGIDPARIFGLGHSNGAMMTQRVVCEAGLYAAAIPVSGPLEVDVERCPAARGRSVLAIHGAEDANVPVQGGKGTKGISQADFNSQAYSQQVMNASGANYQLQVVPGADHNPARIEAVLQQTEGVSLGEKAIRFFGLTR